MKEELLDKREGDGCLTILQQLDTWKYPRKLSCP
jgi:hypothetical protein